MFLRSKTEVQIFDARLATAIENNDWDEVGALFLALGFAQALDQPGRLVDQMRLSQGYIESAWPANDGPLQIS